MIYHWNTVSFKHTVIPQDTDGSCKRRYVKTSASSILRTTSLFIQPSFNYVFDKRVLFYNHFIYKLIGCLKQLLLKTFLSTQRLTTNRQRNQSLRKKTFLDILNNLIIRKIHWSKQIIYFIKSPQTDRKTATVCRRCELQ